MSEKIVSPGVFTKEIDQTFLPAAIEQIGAAVIGPTVKGQQNIPKLVTSYSEYEAAFGSTFLSGSNQYTFFTSISAYNYFQNGGTSLIVTKVANGSWNAASSSLVATGSYSSTLAVDTSPFVLETLSVIIQVLSYKFTGKRIFRMAPLHHHFEKKGWAESTIVIRFWIITIVLALIGLATLKIR